MASKSGMNLRQKKRISYYEVEEPSFDEYLYCEECHDFVYEYCAIHGPLLVIPDDKVPLKSEYPPIVPRAALTIPKVFLHLARSNIPGAGIGVFSTLTLPRGVRFGPYRGLRAATAQSGYCWQIYDRNNKPSHVVDAADAARSNWMRYVNCARGWHEQNLVAYQYRGQLYYRTVKIIRKFDELLVYYGGEFARSLRVDLREYNAPFPYALGNGFPKTTIPNTELDKKSQLKTEKIKQIHQKLSNNNTKSPFYEPTQSTSCTKKDVSEESEDATKNSDVTIKMVPRNLTHEPMESICDECGENFSLKSSLIGHMNSHRQTARKDYICGFRSSKTKSLIRQFKIHSSEKSYECSYCMHKFARKYNLKRHIQTHTDKKPFAFRSSEQSSLKRHIVTYTGEKPYNCTYCTFRSARQSHLKRHILIHTGEKPYKCTYCTFRFARQSDLKRHILIHTGEKPYKCTYCTFRFARQSHLKRHILIHTGEKPYKCTYCTFRFARQSHLKNHILIHTGEKPYKCTYCTFRFARQSDLKRHILIHTGEKPYKCTYCTFRFARQSHLKNHILIHTGEKPYKCTYCTFRFARQSDLKRHILIHTGEKPYKCTYCTFRFARQSHLKRHILIHTGEKPYKCTYCTFRFARQSHLKNHILIHTGEKPYKCTYCTFRFARQSDLKSHILTHTGEKPYKCTYCSFRTARQKSLKRHIRIHTDEKP